MVSKNNTNPIVIEEIPPTQTKKPPQKRRKRAAPKKKVNLTNSKKVKTCSDTKLDPNSEQKIMGLGIKSLEEGSKPDESDIINLSVLRSIFTPFFKYKVFLFFLFI